MVLPDTRSVVVERDLAFPVEQVWEALTRPDLMKDWLMPNDFRPEVGHAFTFAAEWGDVKCLVTVVEPMRRLAYCWSAFDVETVVTWTLMPTDTGTRLRMEQSGFQVDQKHAIGGAKGGWRRFLDSLERSLAEEGAAE